MHLRFGSCPVVVASSAAMAKEFLKTHDLNFASRPHTLFNKHINRNYRNILWSPYGPYFRQARRVCHLTLLSEARMNDYENIRVEEGHSTLHALYRSSGEPIVLKDHILTLFINILTRKVFGRKYEEERGLENFKEMLKETFNLAGAINVADYIPWAGFMDLQRYMKRMKALSEKLDRTYDQALDELIGNGEEGRIRRPNVWLMRCWSSLTIRISRRSSAGGTSRSSCRSKFNFSENWLKIRRQISRTVQIDRRKRS